MAAMLHLRQIGGTTTAAATALTFANDELTTLTQTIAITAPGASGTTIATRTLIIKNSSQLESALSEGLTATTTPGTSTTVSQSPTNASPSTSNSVGSSPEKSLDTKYIVLIIVIICLVLVILGILGWFGVRRRRQALQQNNTSGSTKRKSPTKLELSGRQSVFSMSRLSQKLHLRDRGPAELWTDANRHEMDESQIKILPAPPKSIYELDARSLKSSKR